MDTFLKRARKYAVTGLAGGLLVLGATAVKAETTVVVGYQRIVGPFVSAIADGSFDKAAKEIGYKIDWRQFSSAGDISTAFASGDVPVRSEEHTSELQSLMRTSYAVFCLKKNKKRPCSYVSTSRAIHII